MVEISKLKFQIASQIERLGYPRIAEEIREEAVESVSKAILYPHKSRIPTPKPSPTRSSRI